MIVFGPSSELPCCARHPARAAVAICTRCGSSLCLSCHASDAQGLAVCVECFRPLSPSAPERVVADGALDHDTSGPRLLSLPLDAPAGATVVERVVDTIRWLVRDPDVFFSLVRSSTEPWRAALFGHVCLCVGTVVAAGWQLMLDRPLVEVPEGWAEQGVEPLSGPMLLMLTPLAAAIQLALAAVALHLAAKLLGGQGTLSQTLQIVAYASVAHLLLLVPFAGGLLALAAQLFLQFKGLEHVHQLSRGRALVAGLLPMAVVLLLIGGI